MTETRTDAELVRDARRGSRSAFAELYDRYASLARAWAFDTLGGIDEGRDVCQEVFLRAWKLLDDLDDPERFGGWLRGFVRHVAQERKRARRRSEMEPIASADSVITSTNQLDVVECEEMLQALARLPDPERTALHLFYLQEQSSECARSVLGLSKSGFYKAVERGREQLRGILSSEGVRHERL